MTCLIRASVLIALLTITSACGWQLRGHGARSSVNELYLVSPNRYAPLTQALLEGMQQQRIANQAEASVQLTVGEPSLRKRVVAATSIGSPSQYELSLSVTYQYRTVTTKAVDTQTENAEEPKTLPHTLWVSRAFDYDPNNTVAKREEEDTLLDEMRHELALRILQLAPAAADYGQVKL